MKPAKTARRYRYPFRRRKCTLRVPTAADVWNAKTIVLRKQYPKVSSLIEQIGCFLEECCHLTGAELWADVFNDYVQWTGWRKELWLGEEPFQHVLGLYGAERKGNLVNLKLVTTASQMRRRWARQDAERMEKQRLERESQTE